MVQKSSKERQHEFDVAYMNMAIAMSNLSYAIKKQVGCIVVSRMIRLFHKALMVCL